MKKFLRTNPYLFSLLLAIILIIISVVLQDKFFRPGVLSSNLRGLLPLMFLAIGQVMVIIGGGIDLSVGAIVSLVNAVLVTLITPESSAAQVAFTILAACGVGLLAGLINGLCIALLRLQPIVTTYATSFVFAGLALLVLPRPGGALPQSLPQFYRALPYGIPLAIFVIAVVLLLWRFIRNSRYGQYIYALGGSAEAAYTTGLPVTRLRLSVYLFAGFCAALAALALTLETGSGSPRSGDSMTLDSVVAVVLGGTRLSGGQGGIVGTILGVAILRLIRPIVSFSGIDSDYQTLLNALIIMLALAAPGLFNVLRRRKL
ncbi:MAG: ABC transporter permease [Trueperaceae bacterium]